MFVQFSETLCLNLNQIYMILYPVHNAIANNSNHAIETIESKIAQARKHNHYYDFTNDRDRIKSLIILSNGSICATSLTKAKIDLILANKRKPKSRTTGW